MKRLLDQWERKNSKAKGQQTVDDWEREIADDEVMRDASPPPAPPSQPVVSDDSVELPAPLLPGQVEALETVGICMLVEYMLAPPGAEEPQQLRAFWPDLGVLKGCGAFTPSMRVVSRNDGRGWFLFRI